MSTSRTSADTDPVPIGEIAEWLHKMKIKKTQVEGFSNPNRCCQSNVTGAVLLVLFLCVMIGICEFRCDEDVQVAETRLIKDNLILSDHLQLQLEKNLPSGR